MRNAYVKITGKERELVFSRKAKNNAGLTLRTTLCMSSKKSEICWRRTRL